MTAITFKELKTSPAVKPKLVVSSTSTDATGKTSDPVKNTRCEKKNGDFESLLSIQEIEESDFDSECGVTQPMEPLRTTKSAQDNQN